MNPEVEANVLFNTIAMIRPEHSGGILVIEGDDDHLILYRHVQSDVSVLLGRGGKGAVLAAARLAQERDVRGVLFLVDADYDRITGDSAEYPASVALSTTHDFFMDALRADVSVIDRIIEVHARAAVRRLGLDLSAESVRREAVALAGRVSLLRVANGVHRLGLTLRRFPFGGLPSSHPSDEELARVALGRSSVEISVEQIVAHLKAVRSNYPNAHAIIGDHDFFDALARVMSDRGANGVSGATMFSSFMSSLECRHIATTGWGNSLRAWAPERRAGVLRCPCGSSERAAGT